MPDLFVKEAFPFSVFIGWKADRNKAGNSPAMIPTKKITPSNIKVGRMSLKSRTSIVRLIKALKLGNTSMTMNAAIKKAMIVTKTDSPNNCRINCPLKAPTTLRMPISLERLNARAVARLI